MPAREMRHKTGNGGKESRLPTASGTGDQREGTLFNFEVHLTQGRGFRARVGDGHVSKANHATSPTWAGSGRRSAPPDVSVVGSAARRWKSTGTRAIAIPASATQAGSGHHGGQTGAVTVSGSTFWAINALEPATTPEAAIISAGPFHLSGR